FEARGRAWRLPGGLGNMDEFVTDHWPGFVGMSLRLYDPRTRQWSIYWVSNQKGVLEPPVVGSFSGDVGIFEGRDELDGRPIVVRFAWSEITGPAVRWEQAFSPDAGRTGETNWIMVMPRLLDEAVDADPGRPGEAARWRWSSCATISSRKAGPATWGRS